jgi:hypothetical protein
MTLKSKKSYSIIRDSKDQTPRQRLDAARAEAVEFDNRRKRECWQTKEQAEAAAQETSEIISGDLFGTIPMNLAGKLCGRIFTPQEVRVIIRNEINECVKLWIKGDRVPESSIPKDMEKSVKGKKK